MSKRRPRVQELMAGFWRKARLAASLAVVGGGATHLSLSTLMDLRYRSIFWRDAIFQRNRRALLPTAVLEAAGDVSGEELLWALLLGILSDAKLREAAIEMLKTACYDPALRDDLFQFSKYIVCKLAQSSEMQECLAHTLLKLIADKHIFAAVKQLTLSLLGDPQMHRETTNLLLVVMNREEVRDKIMQLTCWWLAQVLKNPTKYIERYPLLKQIVDITREQIEKSFNEENIAELVQNMQWNQLSNISEELLRKLE